MTTDLTNVTEARIGDSAVNRIYEGGRMVWNRFNWMRWSCGSREEPACACRITHTTVMSETDIIDVAYAYSDGISSGSSYLLINGIAAGRTTVGALYDSRYRYLPAAGISGALPDCRLQVGDEFLLISPPTSVNGGRKFPVRHYTVYESAKTVYIRGNTCYGLVVGSAGQYPANGRHADGYWYVAAPAQGITEVSA